MRIGGEVRKKNNSIYATMHIEKRTNEQVPTYLVILSLESTIIYIIYLTTNNRNINIHIYTFITYKYIIMIIVVFYFVIVKPILKNNTYFFSVQSIALQRGLKIARVSASTQSSQHAVWIPIQMRSNFVTKWTVFHCANSWSSRTWLRTIGILSEFDTLVLDHQ